MAIFEKTIRNKNFDKLLRKLENEIPDSSWSADLEAGSDFKEGDARCSVRVFERYSMMGGNRLSLTLTMFQNADSPVRLSAITAGGSQAVFFKVNTLGEESFLNDVKDLLEEKGRLSPYKAVCIAEDIAAGLSHAHRRNIIHCDIKPHNILITENMHPKIADFGIARMISNMTMVYTNSVIGSVHYLSPEQASGKPVTAQSDIYSLGIVLYEMLTGHVPFDGNTAVAVAMMHVEKTPPPLSTYVEGCRYVCSM